jgi:hypothetical protein
MASINFNATSVEPATAYEILPKGKYLCVAIASEMKATKNNTGEYLQITFEIVEGDNKGRKIFERLNIRNANKTAEDIAQRTLSALCRAVGVMQLSDSEQLHDIPVTLEIAVEEGKGEYGPQNRIKGYSPAGMQAPVTPSPRAASAQAYSSASNGGQATASGTPVWKRK